MLIKKSEDCVDINPHWIAGSDIAVIRKVKNRIFISCCQPIVKCAGSFSNNNYYFVDYLQINPTFSRVKLC